MQLNKAKALLIVGWVALYFGAKAFNVGLEPMARMMVNAWRVQSTVSVPATVLEFSYTDRVAAARYGYRFGNANFEATAVGLADPAAENHGEWQRQWFNQLKVAKESTQPITAWVDPQQPQRAFLDKDINWFVVLYLLPFVLFYPWVAYFAAKMVWAICRAPAGTLWQLGWRWPLLVPMVKKAEHAETFANSFSQNAPMYLRDMSQIALTKAYWAIAAWCLVVWPWVGGFFTGRAAEGLHWLILTFPLGVAVLLGHTDKAIRASRVIQGTRMYTDPHPVRRAEPFTVYAQLPASRLQRTTQFNLTLTENQYDFYHTGPERHEKPWRSTQTASAALRADGSGVLKAQFEVPQRITPLRENVREEWTLDIHEQGGGNAQTFDVMVRGS